MKQSVRGAALRQEASPGREIPSTYRVRDFPMHYIAAIQRQNQINLGRALRPVGITVPVWRALSALHENDGLTIGQLADLVALDRSRLGRLLDEMDSEGLIERQTPPDDRRALVIRRTAAGKRRFQTGLPAVHKHYRKLLHGMSDQEFGTLMRLLRRMKANTHMMSDVADEPD